MGISQFQFEQMQSRLARSGTPGTAPASPPLEKELHRKIMDYCNAQWPRWKYVHSRMDRATSKDQAGVSDFVIFLPQAYVLVVEAKRPGEKPTLAQRDWHAEMARLGHEVNIVHDIREFLLAVETLLNPVGQPLSNPPPTQNENCL
jgi:hypothetical protein